MIENAELIAIIALLGTLFISAVGAAFALGGLPRRGEFNELRKEVKDLSDKVEESRKELSNKIEESNKVLKAELIAEIRRSHQQLLRALINHRHLEPDGEPIFTEPPDAELVAADN